MAKTDDSKQGEGTQEKPKAVKGTYTVLEAITTSVEVPGEGDAPGTVEQVESFVVRGEVTARSKNDAIRTAFNEQKIEGAGRYAAVTSRSFAPVTVKPTVRTALDWS